MTKLSQYCTTYYPVEGDFTVVPLELLDIDPSEIEQYKVKVDQNVFGRKYYWVVTTAASKTEANDLSRELITNYLIKEIMSSGDILDWIQRSNPVSYNVRHGGK